MSSNGSVPNMIGSSIRSSWNLNFHYKILIIVFKKSSIWWIFVNLYHLLVGYIEKRQLYCSRLILTVIQKIHCVWSGQRTWRPVHCQKTGWELQVTLRSPWLVTLWRSGQLSARSGPERPSLTRLLAWEALILRSKQGIT